VFTLGPMAQAIHYIDDAGIVVGSATPLLSSAC